MMLRDLDLDLLKRPVLPRVLSRLPEAATHAVLTLDALLATRPKLTGPCYHARIADLLGSELNGEKELREWIAANYVELPVRWKAFDRARRQADLWLREGRWVAAWNDGVAPPCDRTSGCPQVLFGQGGIEPEQAWAAFFNSRKAKLVSPQAEWLQALRGVLPSLIEHRLGIAGSLGTITYDLVAAAAGIMRSRLFLMLPTPLEKLHQAKDSPLLDAPSVPTLSLTCLTMAVNCSKPTRMICRDRLLAFLSDLHCVLELRAGGNLLRILEKQQKEQPRLQWVYRSAAGHGGDHGKDELLKRFRRRVIGFPERELDSPAPIGSKRKGCHHRLQVLDAAVVKWEDYLYHYTRSCPGPWPGQSYRLYLESLLDGDSLAEHSALATLIRIMGEGRIRASAKVVRGDHPVISWTSMPPPKLGSIRRWNPALIRWTFEPYGLAVKREVLRKRGAKPVIYAKSAAYQKLTDQDRPRFQLHDPPHCSWKTEREWRLPHDLELAGIAPEDAFGFVAGVPDLKALGEQGCCALPIVVLR